MYHVVVRPKAALRFLKRIDVFSVSNFLPSAVNFLIEWIELTSDSELRDDKYFVDLMREFPNWSTSPRVGTQEDLIKEN